jgi:hypothetical protein
LARLGVRGTFSQPGPSRPAAAVRLARTLGRTTDMSRSLALITTLMVSLQPAFAGDLEALDEVGRRIAERPCPRPQVTTKIEKNIHDDTVTDRYITQRCPNAGSEVVRSSMSQYKQVIPLFASLSRADSRIPFAFQVGSLLTRVKGRLGTPEVEKADSITYLLPSETLEERVTFVHDGTRVVSIQWSWYFD